MISRSQGQAAGELRPDHHAPRISPKRRLAIVVSHPIQHFVPFYRALARSEAIELRVIYASRIGLESYFDAGMNTQIVWNMDMLSGYDHVFLEEARAIKDTKPLSVNNPSIGSALSRWTPDVVLIYGYSHLTSMRALFWCKRNLVPAMMLGDSELKAERSPRTQLAKRLVVPRVLSRFDAFLTVGDCNEQYYRHYGVPPHKLFRSPFTIDEERYQAARDNRDELRRQVRGELGIAESDVVALTVGKLSKRKRPEDIVALARVLKSRSPGARNVRFVLAGNGTEMEALQQAVVAEGLPVHFPGFVNVDQLPAYYAAADLLVHPSSADPHPLVVSEAAAIGLPLVISDRVGAAGPTDIARPGENALVFRVGDVGDLATKIISLVADFGHLTAMGRRSREIFGQLDMDRSVQGAVDAVRYVTSPRMLQRADEHRPVVS